MEQQMIGETVVLPLLMGRAVLAHAVVLLLAAFENTLDTAAVVNTDVEEDTAPEASLGTARTARLVEVATVGIAGSIADFASLPARIPRRCAQFETHTEAVAVAVAVVAGLVDMAHSIVEDMAGTGVAAALDTSKPFR
jgi:hypothetical protein